MYQVEISALGGERSLVLGHIRVSNLTVRHRLKLS